MSVSFCCLTSTEARRPITVLVLETGTSGKKEIEEWDLETGANPDDQGCRGPPPEQQNVSVNGISWLLVCNINTYTVKNRLLHVWSNNGPKHSPSLLHQRLFSEINYNRMFEQFTSVRGLAKPVPNKAQTNTVITPGLRVSAILKPSQHALQRVMSSGSQEV